MADLPLLPTTPVPAAAARPATHSPLREARARDGSAQADDDPFQAVLAQELGLVAEDQARPGLDMLAAASDTSLKASDDPAQASADATLFPAFFSLTPLPPALGSERSGNAPATMQPAALVLDARQDPLAKAAAAAATEPQLLTTPAALALDARQDPPAKAAPAAATKLQLPAAPATADFAAPGKFLPAPANEFRREIAFATSVLEKHQAAPIESAAVPAGTGIPAQSVQQFTPAPAAALNARVGAHGWDQSLGDKLVWMAGQSQQVAQLHLNPPELGPLKITLTLNHDQASAQFVSAHALVRDAIEAAMPRLREMLADSGITLANASVSADSHREQAQPQPRAYAAQADVAMADSGVERRGTQRLRLSRGLVDTFA